MSAAVVQIGIYYPSCLPLERGQTNSAGNASFTTGRHLSMSYKSLTGLKEGMWAGFGTEYSDAQNEASPDD